MLISSTRTVVERSLSVVGFGREGAGRWEVKNRFITIDGQKAFHYSFACETSTFLFERLDGADKHLDRKCVIDSLNAGLSDLNQSTVTQLKQLMPSGEYFVVLRRVKPTIATPGQASDYFSNEQKTYWHDEIDPQTSYYRLQSTELPERVDFFEFLVPMHTSEKLDPDRVNFYKAALPAARTPTALALSVIESKRHHSSDRSHLILTHYLLDGHHKVCAAATGGGEITLMSFIAINEGDGDRIGFDHLFHCLDEA